MKNLRDVAATIVIAAMMWFGYKYAKNAYKEHEARSTCERHPNLVACMDWFRPAKLPSLEDCMREEEADSDTVMDCLKDWDEGDFLSPLSTCGYFDPESRSCLSPEDLRGKEDHEELDLFKEMAPWASTEDLTLAEYMAGTKIFDALFLGLFMNAFSGDGGSKAATSAPPPASSTAEKGEGVIGALNDSIESVGHIAAAIPKIAKGMAEGAVANGAEPLVFKDLPDEQKRLVSTMFRMAKEEHEKKLARVRHRAGLICAMDREERVPEYCVALE